MFDILKHYYIGILEEKFATYGEHTFIKYVYRVDNNC